MCLFCMTIPITLLGRRRTPRVQEPQSMLNRVNQSFEYRGNTVYRRSSLEPPPPLPKQHARLREPPYPPKEKCVTCTQFTRQGSTGYTIKETCLVCGHATTTGRDLLPNILLTSVHMRTGIFEVLRGLFIEPFASSVARFWTRLRWSSKRLEKQFPTRFWKPL